MFDPNEHLMKLKGKDYLQVAWRLVWFRDAHPDWSINAEALEIADDHAIFKAVICDENGVQKSSGHGSESKRDFGDFLEKAETKAVGRALAMLGYGTQFTAYELDEGQRIVDAPIMMTNADTKKALDEAVNDQPDDAVTADTVLELPKRTDFNAYKEISAWCADHGGMQMGRFVELRTRAINAGKVPDIPCKELTEEQLDALLKAIGPMVKGENK
jgi:hypothetical protein